MRKFLYILAAAALLVGCQKEPALENSALQISTGITNNSLYIGGSEGSVAQFAINAKYDWHILATEGFVCEPSSGQAGNNITITARALQANNTLDTVRLSKLNFRLKSTTFVGIVAYQRPQVIVGDGYKKVYVSARSGASTTLKIYSATPDFEAVGTAGIGCREVKADYAKGEYELEVSVESDNSTTDVVKKGEVTFEVAGKRQAAQVEVWQQSALRVERDVILSSRSGSQATFEVVTPFDFEVKNTSSQLTAVRGEGNTVVVTANADNTGEEQIRLGEIEIVLKSNSAYGIKVGIYQRATKAAQTIMFYYLGTSLGAHYKNNIAKTALALDNNIQGNARVLVFSQSSDYAATLKELRYDTVAGKCVEEVIKEYKLATPYSVEALATQLSDMVEAAPAKGYGLIIGSHGKGWIPKSSARANLMLSARERELRERLWTPAAGALQTRHMGDASNKQYNTTELANAIESAVGKLQYIIFDACFMANAESAYDLRNVAERIVASPCEVMGAGFPYNVVLPELLHDGGARFDLDAVCSKYVGYYNSLSSQQSRSACVALIDCSQMEALAAAVKRVNAAGVRSVKLDGVQTYEGLSVANNPAHIFYDLEDYVQQACTDAQATQAMVEQLDKTVTSRYHTERFYSVYNSKLNDITHYSGITTSAPIMFDTTSTYHDEWQQTAWYEATH